METRRVVQASAGGGHAGAAFDGNPKAQAALDISPREMEVLQHLAAGRSYKEIAQALEVSPNTVKTHVGRRSGISGVGRPAAQ